MFPASVTVMFLFSGVLHKHLSCWFWHGCSLDPLPCWRRVTSLFLARRGLFVLPTGILGRKGLVGMLVPGVVIVVRDEQVLNFRVGYGVVGSPCPPLPDRALWCGGWFVGKFLRSQFSGGVFGPGLVVCCGLLVA